MTDQMHAPRVRRRNSLAVIFFLLAAIALLAFSGVACEKKEEPSTQPSTSTQSETAATEPADAEAADGEAVDEEADGEVASTEEYLDEQASDERTRAHEQSAVFALSDIKTLLAQQDYQAATDAARSAAEEYADTQYAQQFTDLQAECEKQLAEAADADARQQAEFDEQSDEERLARQERFEQFRDDGVACMEDKNFPSAIYYFQAALNEQDDPEVASMLEEAVENSTNPRIAVGDFTVSGSVGIPDAGRSVAEILLTKFDPSRFQLVERSRLAALMDERDLTLAGIVEDPKRLADKKVKGIRFIVVGTVSKLGLLTVTARLVDVGSGEIMQTAEIEANDAVMLQGRLAELALLLSMTAEEKQAYMEDHDRLAQQQAQYEAEQREADEAAARDEQAREQYWRERHRQERLQRQQHERDAVVVVGDIKSMLARGLFRQAARYARQAVLDFADTSSAMELTDLRAVAEREAIRQALAQQEADEEAQREAAELEARMQFSRHRQEGMAAYQRDDYRHAAESFREALRFRDSDEVRGLLRAAQEKLRVDEDRAYSQAMQRAAKAMAESRWGDAMAAYQAALALRKTDEARSGVEAAGKKLQQQDRYRQMLQAARDAMGKGDFQAAWQWINAAGEMFPDAPEAKALAREIGPAVLVRAEVDGNERRDAKVALDGEAVRGRTPVGLRLRKGQQHEIVVTVPPHDGKTYEPAKQTITPSQDGFQELVVQVDEVKKTPEQIAREKKYNDAVRAAKDAIADVDYAAAWRWVDEALAADPAGQEAKDLADRLGATLSVKATLDGQDYAGARIRIDGKEQGQTPASFRFKKGQQHKVSVTIRGKRGKTYSTDELTFAPSQNGHTDFVARIAEVQLPVAPPAAPTPEAEPALPTPPAPEETAPTPQPEPTPQTGPAAEEIVPAVEPPVAPAPESKPAPPDKKGRKKQDKPRDAKEKDKPADAAKDETKDKADAEKDKPADVAREKDKPADAAKAPENPKYQAALHDAQRAIKRKDYKAAWQQIDLALSLVPDGKEAASLAETLGPTLTVRATLDGREHRGARVTLDGQPQKDETPAGFKLKPGAPCKVEVTVVKRGKSYTTDTRTITPGKTGNTEFVADIQETK